jgi:hypothetical protein
MSAAEDVKVNCVPLFYLGPYLFTNTQLRRVPRLTHACAEEILRGKKHLQYNLIFYLAQF